MTNTDHLLTREHTCHKYKVVQLESESQHTLLKEILRMEWNSIVLCNL